METTTTTLRKRTPASALLDPKIVLPAIGSAFRKLNPVTLMSNPVMFVLEVVTALTTVILVRDLVAGSGHIGFEFQIVLWLWFTVLFANFSEAVAEGRGKAQADALRKTRTETLAKLLTGPGRGNYKTVPGTSLKVGDMVIVEVGETIPSELPSNFAYTIRQPHGVVAVVTPWNFPVAIPVWKIAPALVAGNTVVFKPATNTPATAARIVEIFAEAGVPAGVLNLVLGSGSEAGDEIVSHRAVRAISFTGSNGVGIKLYEQAARRGVRVQCEMGGKNPVVVLEDADMGLAVESTAQGAFGSTGQRCTATSRAVVVESVADEFVQKIAERAKAMRLGDGMNSETEVGPIVDGNQFKSVLRYIDIGREDGAELACGGETADGAGLRKGFFVRPTVFDRVTPDMRIAREEIFGPVLSVLRVKDFEEALQVDLVLPR